MKPSHAAAALAAALVGAAVLAWQQGGTTASSVAPRAAEIEMAPDQPPVDLGQALPPNHPAIGGTAGDMGDLAPAEDEPALQWTAPSSWKEVASPNAIRLATYHVPAAAGAPDEAELSVARAGGSTDANVRRWIGQFDDAGKDTREEKMVRGMRVTVVEVSGTYTSGGAMMGGPAERRPGWALRGAVVEAPDGSYFFKLTGPAATVRAARADFDALVASVDAPTE